MMELKPCPFCGGKAEYQNDIGSGDEGFWEWYECTTCAAKTDSAEAWNRRADLPSPLGVEAKCATCQDDPFVCASIPGLRHCEAATRDEDGTHAAMLAAALKLPEVAALVEALHRIKQDAGGWPYDAVCDALAALEAKP